MRYADGSRQAFPDWFGNTPVAGDDLVATTAHLDRANDKAPHSGPLRGLRAAGLARTV